MLIFAMSKGNKVLTLKNNNYGNYFIQKRRK